MENKDKQIEILTARVEELERQVRELKAKENDIVRNWNPQIPTKTPIIIG